MAAGCPRSSAPPDTILLSPCFFVKTQLRVPYSGVVHGRPTGFTLQHRSAGSSARSLVRLLAGSGKQTRNLRHTRTLPGWTTIPRLPGHACTLCRIPITRILCASQAQSSAGSRGLSAQCLLGAQVPAKCDPNTPIPENEPRSSERQICPSENWLVGDGQEGKKREQGPPENTGTETAPHCIYVVHYGSSSRTYRNCRGRAVLRIVRRPGTGLRSRSPGRPRELSPWSWHRNAEHTRAAARTGRPLVATHSSPGSETMRAAGALRSAISVIGSYPSGDLPPTVRGSAAPARGFMPIGDLGPKFRAVQTLGRADLYVADRSSEGINVD